MKKEIYIKASYVINNTVKSFPQKDELSFQSYSNNSGIQIIQYSSKNTKEVYVSCLISEDGETLLKIPTIKSSFIRIENLLNITTLSKQIEKKDDNKIIVDLIKQIFVPEFYYINEELIPSLLREIKENSDKYNKFKKELKSDDLFAQEEDTLKKMQKFFDSESDYEAEDEKSDEGDDKLDSSKTELKDNTKELDLLGITIPPEEEI